MAVFLYNYQIIFDSFYTHDTLEVERDTSNFK